MSTTARTIRFHCSNDCRQTGCPGHRLDIIHRHVSDTVEIWEDGHVLHVYDDSQWCAILAMEKYPELHPAEPPDPPKHRT